MGMCRVKKDIPDVRRVAKNQGPFGNPCNKEYLACCGSFIFSL